MIKNIHKVKFVLLILMMIILLSPLCSATNEVSTIATGTENEIQNEVTTTDTAESTYKYIASDIYEFNEDVVVKDIIDGNAFILGNNVTISGEIGGDVFVAGKNIKFTDTAYIHGSIFVAGDEVTFNGICYDIYGACNKFTLDSNAIIARDLRLAAETTTINGQIKKNVYLTTNNLVFNENAQNLIAGNLEYYATTEFKIPEGAVTGDVKYTLTTPVEEKHISIGDIIKSYITNILSSIVYSLVIVLLIIWLTPNFKEKAGNLFKTKAPLSLGVGLLTSIIILVGSVILLIMTALLGLGIGISAAAITIWILALTISKTVFALGIAKLITDKINKNGNLFLILFTLLAVLVIELIGIIPLIGGLFSLAATMIGLGIIVLNLIKKNKLEEKTNNVEENSTSTTNK